MIRAKQNLAGIVKTKEPLPTMNVSAKHKMVGHMNVGQAVFVHEIWTITLKDGTVIEKDMVLV